MAPFFYVVATDESPNATTVQSQFSMATVVVANLTGLMTGGMYVLLRSSRIGKIGPKGYYEFDSRRSVRRPKTTVPHSFIFTRQMEQPVPPPAQLPQRRASSFYTAQDVELGVGAANAMPLNEAQKTDALPDASTVGVATTTPGPVPSQEPLPRKSSAYNLFPRDTAPDPKSIYLLPATAYMPANNDKALNPFADELPAPPTIRFSGSRHNRDSSLGSSATVPIGIRVSNINDMPPGQSFYQVPPPPRATRPSRPVSRVPVAAIPDRLIIPDDEANPENKDKQLPPVPLALMKKEAEKEVKDDEIRLSPTVYSPKRTPSKGKGKASSPTAPPPGPRHSPESYGRVDEAEWI